MLASPVGWVAAGMSATGNNDNGFSDWMYDRAITVRNAGGALVGWDPNAEDGWHAWKEDGLAAGTSAVLSVGTFFIPGVQVTGGLKAGSVAARVARVSGAVTEFAVQGGSWAVRGGVKVLTGLRTVATRFDLDGFGGGFGPQVAVAGAGAGVRANPFAGLLNAMTEGGASRTSPGTTPHTPVRDALFAPRGDVPTVEGPRADAPTAPRPDAPEGLGGDRPGSSGNGRGSQAPELPEPQTPRQSAQSPHAPTWDGGTVRGGAPDVSDVPLERRGDPRYDPTHPHYDGTPRGEHGNVGTVDPDTPSTSGATLSGRLIDPDVVPEALRPYVDAGTVVNDNGVLHLAQDVEITFERKQAKHDLAEFERQIDLQERALNQMTLEDWTGRMDSRGNRIDNQEAYRRHLAGLIADRLVEERGMSRPDAVAEARRQLQGQHPLHGPDQRAGGNPEQITGMGDGPINSSIGSQWRNNADLLEFEVADALLDAGIDPAFRGDIRMNVRLRLVDAVPVP